MCRQPDRRYHVGRNCPRCFPGDVKPGQTWRAQYKVETSNGAAARDVDCRAPECPVSYVKPETWELFEALMPALEMQEACGVALDATLPAVRRDARIMDAALVIKRCQAQRREAMMRG